jgi:allantoin racemase
MQTAASTEQVRLAAGEGFDAAIIACFGDPGLDAAREVPAGVPVIDGVAATAAD